MVEEARFENLPQGKRPQGDGWFIVNARETAWFRNEKFGAFCAFEGDMRFRDFGINLHVLQPGKPACHYHSESEQEGFLVLAGECLVVIEGQERKLRAWDYVHCPKDTRHVFVGAGDGPCMVLMVGSRDPETKLHYPVDELAQKHDASSPVDTQNPAESYAGQPRSQPMARPADGLDALFDR